MVIIPSAAPQVVGFSDEKKNCWACRLKPHKTSKRISGM
jgi:hypothetical protein